MKKIQVIALVGVLVVGTQARAALFDIGIVYTDQAGHIAGTGSVVASANVGGGYTAISGSFTVTAQGAADLSLPKETYNLMPVFSPPTSTIRFPGGNLTYDNQISSGTPIPTYAGLVFADKPNSGDQDPGTGINLWWNDMSATGPHSYVYDDHGAVNLNITAVPEPTTMVAGALLLLPFGVSTIRMLRKSRTS